MLLDAHQHFWQFDPVRDAWITEDMAVLRRDFLPADLAPVLYQNGLDGCVAVQADQSETETRFLLDLAQQNTFIRAVVGWADLSAPDICARLEYWKQFPRLRGFRHILQGEKPEFMLRPEFMRGIRELGRQGFTYDILVFPRHLPALRRFLKNFENQPFIIDHLAKPYIRRGLIAQWRRDIRALAKHSNLCCKVSGLVTEADWQGWQAADFRPYLDVVFEAFGSRRVVYGSDWPVCLLAADYEAQKNVVEDYVHTFSDAEKAAFWGENGARFYGLDLF